MVPDHDAQPSFSASPLQREVDDLLLVADHPCQRAREPLGVNGLVECVREPDVVDAIDRCIVTLKAWSSS
jgi:hypothetical protein